jgi:AcrR family transcriptional regulator
MGEDALTNMKIRDVETRVRGPAGRLTAEERREAVLQAAVAEFALYGLHGSSTEVIAARAGISQPYLFALFGTKKDLFIAAVERVYAAIEEVFTMSGERCGENELLPLGDMYAVLRPRRDELLVMLHAFAAATDPDIGWVVRQCFARLYRLVRQIAHAGEGKLPIVACLDQVYACFLGPLGTPDGGVASRS